MRLSGGDAEAEPSLELEANDRTESTMKIKARLIVSVAIGSLSLLASLQSTHAQNTAFTYQGRLNDGGHPANGNYDLSFCVWNAASGPSQIGGGVTPAPTVNPPSVSLSASPTQAT
jgi:hypothetical protein